MKKLPLVLVLFLGLIACEAQRSKAWQEDIDFWLAEVKKQHYIYKSTPLPTGFQARLEKLKASINTYSDQRIVVELLGLSSLLGDGHTYVLPWGGKTVAMALPFRFYLFADGLFVIDAQPGFEEWIGRRIAKFGSVTPDEVMKRLEKFVSRDNDQGTNWIGPFLLSFEGTLQALGVEGNGKYTLIFDDQGKSETKEFMAVPFQPTRGIPKLPALRSTNNPLYLQKVSQTYWIKSLTPSALFVQFNQVMNDPNESLRQFASRLADSIRTVAPKKLVIDVRHNNGGNADLLGPLLDVLQQFKSQSGKEIYILTGRNTFSAAQIFISKADRLVKPIFAGEMSSSKPNFVGEENGVILPNSQTICSISNRYHESIPGDTRQGIEPQIKIVLTSQEYFSGKDPVLEAVLK
jgi:hypothetical protein